MSLVEKPTTPKMAQANRENGQKSTGPQTALGLSRFSLKACKHGAFAKVSPAYMKQLGEDPADFERLRESLRRDLGPEDSIEEMLVDDLAEIRWRLMRLKRAEAAILANRRLNDDRERVSARLIRHDSPADVDRYSRYGELSSSDSAGKFEHIVGELVRFREAIQTKGFQEDEEGHLKDVYG